jgi:hypothetical protein
MVPNHMGIDSPWVIEHPDWFLSRWESPFPAYSFNGPDLSHDGRVEIKIEDHYYDQTDAAVAFRLRHTPAARPATSTTATTAPPSPGTTPPSSTTPSAYVREHVIQTILHVARLFPIIRFDAAMTLARRHVQRLWFPSPAPAAPSPRAPKTPCRRKSSTPLMPHEFWREVVDRVAPKSPAPCCSPRPSGCSKATSSAPSACTASTTAPS